MSCKVNSAYENQAAVCLPYLITKIPRQSRNSKTHQNTQLDWRELGLNTNFNTSIMYAQDNYTWGRNKQCILKDSCLFTLPQKKKSNDSV